jgi:hypothetical protein
LLNSWDLKEVYSILEKFKINCDVKLFKNDKKVILENSIISQTITEKNSDQKSEVKNNEIEKSEIDVKEVTNITMQEKTTTNL